MKKEYINKIEIRCYDNGGKTFDRYTVIYMSLLETNDFYSCVCMSDHPFHPQGFGQHSTAIPGRHLGRRIKFKELPPDCQKLVNSDLAVY